MYVSKIVVRQNGNGPPRRVRKLRRAPPPPPTPPPNPAELDPDYVDPAKEAEYERQVLESDGFDVDSCPLPDGGIVPYVLTDKYDYPYNDGLLCRLGLHCFNLQQGTNLELVAMNKYNSEMFGVYLHYITLEAIDTCNNFPYSFQTIVSKNIIPAEAPLVVQTELCRLKVPNPAPRTTPLGFERGWLDEEVDDFYKGEMPIWSTIDDLPKEQAYQLQESDLKENQWVHLYAEFAFHFKWIGYGDGLKSYLPLEFNSVIIQTKESEGEEALKANNSIFYMSFKGNGDPSGMDIEYQAIIRRTMDGMPGHIRLEVNCLAYKSN